MLIVEVLLLLLVVCVAVFAICSAHIPGVRDLTGAAPLVPEEDTTAQDFAATNRARLSESVEEWAERTSQQPTRTPRPVPRDIELPAPRKEGS